MKNFVYKVKDNKTGKIIKSTIKAETEIKAGKMLLEQGFVPISITEQKEESALANFNNKIRLKDKVVFSRQLATLIGAGLPISQSLRTVYEQTTNKKMKSIIGEVTASVEAGKKLTDAFGDYPDAFDSLFLALLASGEASGTLDDALKKVADQQEKSADLISKVRGALVYPSIVLFVIVAVMIFMMVAVMPQVNNLYRDMRLELPFISKMLIAVSSFISTQWWLIFLLIGGAVFFLSRYLKTEPGIKNKDQFKLNAPLFKGMLRKLYMSRFMRTSQTLLSTGVPMLDTLSICGMAVGNYWIKEAIGRASEKVRGGKNLSVALKTEEYILPLVSQMIKIGEQSGKIDEMMGKSADIFEKELDEEIANLSKVIEPALMVFLALAAGAMVGAILLPIYGMLGNVKT